MLFALVHVSEHKRMTRKGVADKKEDELCLQRRGWISRAQKATMRQEKEEKGRSFISATVSASSRPTFEPHASPTDLLPA